MTLAHIRATTRRLRAIRLLLAAELAELDRREGMTRRMHYEAEGRCEDGRLFVHRPQRDDPDFEIDAGTCPDCGGEGCERASSTPRDQDDLDGEEAA